MEYYLEGLKKGRLITELDNENFLDYLDVMVYKAIIEYRDKLKKLDNSKY